MSPPSTEAQQVTSVAAHGPGSWMVKVWPALPLLAALSAATQVFAYQHFYAPELGRPWVGDIFAPWMILRWAADWGAVAPQRFMVPSAAAAAAFLPTALILRHSVRLAQTKPTADPTLHGARKWATWSHIRAAGLDSTEPDGVIVGGLERSPPWTKPFRPLMRLIWSLTVQPLRHSGPEHILVFAPTRSGKGVSLIDPTLLSWPESCVITDVKGELYSNTAGWRKHAANNLVMRFDPSDTSERGARWNPLLEVRKGTEMEIKDVQNLAFIVCDNGDKRDHWFHTARGVLEGLILHALYTSTPNKPASLGMVADLLAITDPEGEKRLWQEMSEAPHFINGETHPHVAAVAAMIQAKPPNEYGSVISTLRTRLELFRDPVVARNMAWSDFRILDLMHQSQPLSVYLVVRADDQERVKPIVRIFITILMTRLQGPENMTKRNGRTQKHYRHRLLLMLDELPAFGKLEVLEKGLATCAGYGIKAYLITQDLRQLQAGEKGYGREETVSANCHVKIAFAPNNYETAKHLSEVLGETTRLSESRSVSGKRSGALGNVSLSLKEHRRALMTPAEILELRPPAKDGQGNIVKPGAMLITVAGFPPIYGTQFLWFQNPKLKARSQLPEPEFSDSLYPQALPTEAFDPLDGLSEVVQ